MKDGGREGVREGRSRERGKEGEGEGGRGGGREERMERECECARTLICTAKHTLDYITSSKSCRASYVCYISCERNSLSALMIKAVMA